MVSLQQSAPILMTRQQETSLSFPCSPESRYVAYLPIIFHENEFLRRFLQLFETVWEPLEQRQDHIACYFDPLTCPPAFVSWLGRWVGIEIDGRLPDRRQRTLVAAAVALFRSRGTREGLRRLIEICTGVIPEIHESPSEPCVFHVKVKLPSNTDIDPRFIEDLIQMHKPAHTGYTLEVIA